MEKVKVNSVQEVIDILLNTAKSFDYVFDCYGCLELEGGGQEFMTDEFELDGYIFKGGYDFCGDEFYLAFDFPDETPKDIWGPLEKFPPQSIANYYTGDSFEEICYWEEIDRADEMYSPRGWGD